MADLHNPPADLPVPEDDGAADHLPGARLPSAVLPESGGEAIDLAQGTRETLAIYV